MRIARLPLVLLTACTAAEAGPGPAPLRFTLKVVEAEHSMDSNSQTESFTVEGGTLSWTWDYGGYHPSREFKRHKSARAAVAHPDELRKLIEKSGLTAGGSESIPTTEAHQRSVEATLELTVGGKTTRVEVKGALPRDGGPKLYQGLMALREALRELLPADR